MFLKRSKIEKQLREENEQLRAKLLQSEEKLKEKSLGPSERLQLQQYQNLFAAIQDGIIIIQDESICFVSDEWASMLGYTVDELTKMNFVDLLSPDERPLLRKVYHDLLSGKNTVNDYPFKLLHKDGNQNTAVCVLFGIIRFNDAPAFICIMKHCAAGECKGEDSQRVVNQLRHGQKMETVGSMAGGMAHDMNNVLGAIMSLASVLREELTSSSEVWQRDVEDILAAARRGRDLTHNMLSFSRKIKLKKENISLAQLVHGVRALLARTSPKNITWRISFDRETPPIVGDFGQLSHAVMNVCINAVDAMKEGGQLSVSTYKVRYSKADLPAGDEFREGTYSVLKIADTGCGISEEIQSRIFEPFFSTKGSGKGTGLGLSMVKEIVSKHNGFVTVESSYGQGTLFMIHMPAAKVSRADFRRSGVYQKADAIGSGVVLLVDDEDIIRRSASRVLRKLGLEVRQAKNGKEAIEIFEIYHSEITLVLLDMAMPVMGGEETFDELRAISRKVPILLASGFSLDDKTDLLLQKGAAGFVEKPFDIQTLAKQILSITNAENR